MKLKILLITTDLYNQIGGGQTVYRKIIESTPEVDFFYFCKSEAQDAPRPANATAISLLPRRDLRVIGAPPFPHYQRHSLHEADQFARSVAGLTFDLVDIPDFQNFGGDLRSAFKHHAVSVKRIVLALHGNISTTVDMNWGSAGDNVLEHRMREEDQFRAADGVYGISTRYIEDWKQTFHRPVVYIDPIHFVHADFGSRSHETEDSKPSLYCIGRSERRKGNDLFVEIVAWLRKSSFEQAAHVGDQDYSHDNISSGYLLENIAKKRGLQIPHSLPMNREQLLDLYSRRSIVVLPTRYDTLNLAALEALFSGCPVVVSDQAGVCDYLDATHPGLPYTKVDFGNFYSAIPALQELLDNYDSHRSKLADYLSTRPTAAEPPLQMGQVYAEFLDHPPAETLEQPGHLIPYVEYKTPLHTRALERLHDLLPRLSAERLPAPQLRRSIRDKFEWLKTSFHKEKSRRLGDENFYSKLMDAKYIPWRLHAIAHHGEASRAQLREKLDAIYANCDNPVFRCNFWREIARIERIRGNELIAVTYELRILRLLGEDKLKLLPNVRRTLEKHGLIEEARAAVAMYADPENSETRVYDYLREAYERNRSRQDRPWLYVVDQRTTEAPRVSVVVSLYNAADKLNFFLTALSQQTLVKKGEVEIILVDSASPSDERKVYEEFSARHPINAVYARSENRETIQAAWNRGIGLARAPFLVFLGVDETLYPEGLEVLADELDQKPDVDWVMANSLVTAVEESGVLKHDIMTYDRTGATKDHTYLDTCYLSWVGGMYRRSLHDRFGYYDETFGAAGDTEIKNRILPHIKTSFIPRTLGLFLNYPDGQTTASPKAEIEDLRAWYIHRTAGGIRYAFENRPDRDAEELLVTCLGYRKSFCGHLSSDIDYAKALADHLARKNVAFGEITKDLAEMQDQLRALEFTERPVRRVDILLLMARTWRSFKKYEEKHRSAYVGRGWPSYSVFNDNRFEQHSWLWKST